LSIHHITNEELQSSPPASTARIPEDAEFIIGHNVDFDWIALGSPPVKRICTQALARMLYPEIDSHKLGALMYHLRPDVAKVCLKEAHSASVDVRNCWLILVEMLVELENLGYFIDGFEALWGVSERARIPTVMPFGKHKGMRIAEVPRNYVSWYERQEQTDPYLLEAFRRAGLIGGRRK
jgi:exodeoxyribonuclease X